MRLVANDADEPAISRDGRHIAYNLNVGEIGDIYVATSTSPQPFATIATDLVSYSTAGPPSTTNGSSSSPAISEHGRWVAFHSYEGGLLSSDPRFATGWHVYVRQRPAVLTVSPIEFGNVQVGTSLDLGTTVTNLGLSGFVITSIAASGPFAVVGGNCPGVLHPGQSCTVNVRFSPAAAVVSNGQLTVRDDTYPPVPLAYSGALRGAGTLVPVDTTTTTTPPGTTVPPGATVNLAGTATDLEQGVVSSQLAWSSSRDGVLDTGAALGRVLSPGNHVLTAEVTDETQLTGSSQVSITVSGGSVGCGLGPELVAGLLALWAAKRWRRRAPG